MVDESYLKIAAKIERQAKALTEADIYDIMEAEDIIHELAQMVADLAKCLQKNGVKKDE